MNWNKWVRQGHRWVSIAFTLVSAGIFLALGLGEQPAEWIYMLPLLPLFLLVVTGLYLFVLPYAARGRAPEKA
ncbi:MAG: hypothetical protein CVT79_15365 [Alphaproteobacteria bacterium HGW-Alphaproteobacteria-18]|nr:MAG: hypothetical protein CVT79_15365 [Alphaproteobacteria bacterium HGW-Alphaproteobacteria-18]